MAKSKRMVDIRKSIDTEKVYNVSEAIELLKTVSKVKFRESFDVSLHLGIDARKSDQMVRGVTQLPHGTGKTVRVAVFAQGANADAAVEAGAEVVGFEDLAEKIKNSAKGTDKLDFDVLIATPDAMRLLGPLGRILGPKGLMPNPKLGTVTPNVAEAVKNAKAGQVTFRTEKAGIVHCSIGKVDFEVQALAENLAQLVGDLKRAKPSTAKGVYLRKLVFSTTMGPGLLVDLGSI